METNKAGCVQDAPEPAPVPPDGEDVPQEQHMAAEPEQPVAAEPEQSNNDTRGGAENGEAGPNEAGGAAEQHNQDNTSKLDNKTDPPKDETNVEDAQLAK